MVYNIQKLKIFLLVLASSLVLLTGCNVIDGIFEKDKKQKNTIHPVLLNGKWGYINQNGEMVISPRYDEARDVSGNYAAVRNGTLWGFVKENPIEVVVTSKFAILGEFENGLAPAQLPGGKYGYIDGTGEFFFDPQFDFATKFSDGYAAVRTDGLWGYVTSSGSIAIEPAFSGAKPFSDDLAAVETFDGWVYINSAGETVLQPSFRITDAGEFEDGLAPIQTVDGWGYINRSGNPVIASNYDEAGKFVDGTAWVNVNGYIGYIDKKGKLFIPPQFKNVKPFSENIAAVQVNNNWFYISKNSGKIVIKEPYKNAESFVNGIARVQKGEGENATYGYLNKNGEYIWFPTK
ncbi:MAG: WG repeat-containing protein [Balneola sp.]|nr:WG repeat-containing protein [Balneola sp.]MBO6651510.1 WG repeat-containing protein [Balneola sp.]MBO6710279.1 WG repeat-containing protein [Balneola sp.]MBO6798964.1 WG repeat-containing protein [Balneola sp.]MBO6870078.1 WG repeat-containing protein [Balneola sp.]